MSNANNLVQSPHVGDVKSITDWTNLALALLSWQEWAIFWILIGVIGPVEASKFLWRAYCDLKLIKRKMKYQIQPIITWTIAIISGLFICYFVWPKEVSAPWFIAGPCIAVFLLLSHKAGIFAIAMKWPELSAKLSGDPRTVKRNTEGKL